MSSPDHSHLLPSLSKDAEELYDTAPCAFIFTRPDGTFVEVNRTFLSWVGKTRAELIGRRRLQDELHLGSRIFYETHLGPLLRMQGTLSEIALDLHGPLARPIPILLHSTLLLDATGEPTLVRTTLFNITERRRYERELVEARQRAEASERRLRLLTRAGEILREPMDALKNLSRVAQLATQDFCDACTLDLPKESGDASSELNRLAGYHRFADRTLPDPIPLRPGDLRSILLIENTDHASEMEQIEERLPGFCRWADSFKVQSLLICPVRFENRTVAVLSFYLTELGQRFSVSDIEFAEEIASRAATAIETAKLHEENNRSHDALRESHEWLETTLRSIGDAVIAVHPDRTVSYLNSAAESLTGWTSDEAKGLPMEKVFPIVNQLTGEPAFNPINEVLATRYIAELANNTALIRRDGTRIVIEDSAAPIVSEDGVLFGAVLVFRDTTEKHRDETKMRQALQELQEEREVREKFVATLTHDLRNPITAVKVSAQLILKKADSADTVRTLSVRLLNAVNRADQMIQDLLDVNRIRAGETIPLQLTDTDLIPEIEAALLDLTTVHGDRFSFTGPKHARGRWNAPSLRRVVENLCNNAVKYGYPHTPIRLALDDSGPEYRLSVHNDGLPIDAADLPTLFNPYKRTESANRGAQKGWGLGLTLVRGVAVAHGGNVEVTSSKEAGTTFTVILPRLSSSELTV